MENVKTYTLHRPEPGVEQLQVVAKSHYDALLAEVVSLKEHVEFLIERGVQTEMEI